MLYNTQPINAYFQLHQYKKFLDIIDGGFIAGGCFKNIFKNEPVKDIDIFFINKESFENAVKVYLTKYKKLYENENCIAFKDNNGLQIELVRSIFGKPIDVVSQFDFTIVKAFLEQKYSFSSTLHNTAPNIFTVQIDERLEYNFTCHNQFFEHLSLNKLVIDDGMPKSVATFNRALKYTKYGYGLCRESKVKLINAIISNGNPNDINGELYFGFD